MNSETLRKLKEAISFIENTAQNEQIYDQVVINDWQSIESDAKELREAIDDMETLEQYEKREQRRRQQND